MLSLSFLYPTQTSFQLVTQSPQSPVTSQKSLGGYRTRGAQWLISVDVNCSSYSIKQLISLLLPLDGMLVHSTLLFGILQVATIIRWCCECKMSCPRTQQNHPSQGQNIDVFIKNSRCYSLGSEISNFLHKHLLTCFGSSCKIS